MNVQAYLKKVKELEALCYEQEKIIYRIQAAMKKLSSPVLEKLKNYEVVYETPGPIYILLIWISCGILAFVPAGIIYVLLDLFGIKIKFLLVFVITTTVPTLCSLFADAHKNNIHIKNNEEIEKENHQISYRNSKAVSINKQKMDTLGLQLKKTENNLIKTRKLLNELYNWNIIHPKYRNFVAVCSLYEYYSTGRCSQLTGHEGGYNIYENEVRLNFIINKLDIVIQKLEAIKNNQYELYTAIVQSNQNFNKVSGCLENLVSHTEEIKNLTILNEYNSRITASNTETIKWIQTFDHIL